MGSFKLEIFKFGLCLSVPIVATTIYAQPDCIDMIVRRWRYITYPPQATTREELLAKLREISDEEDTLSGKKAKK